MQCLFTKLPLKSNPLRSFLALCKYSLLHPFADLKNNWILIKWIPVNQIKELVNIHSLLYLSMDHLTWNILPSTLLLPLRRGDTPDGASNGWTIEKKTIFLMIVRSVSGYLFCWALFLGIEKAFIDVKYLVCDEFHIIINPHI